MKITKNNLTIFEAIQNTSLKMTDLLSEFDNVAKKKTPQKLIIILFSTSVILIYLYFLIPRNVDQISISYYFTREMFIFLAFGIIPLLIVYLFYLKGKFGWLLMTAINIFSSTFVGRGFYDIYSDHSHVYGIIEWILISYIFLSSLLITILLYQKKIISQFKVDLRYLTISILFGLLIFFAVLMSF